MVATRQQSGSQDLPPKDLSSGFDASRTLIRLAWSERGRLALASVCMGISAAATAGYAYLVGPVIRSLFLDASTPVPSADVLTRLSTAIAAAEPWWIGLAIVSAAAVKGASYFGQNTLAVQAAQRALHNLRSRLYRGLLSLNPLSPEACSRGELIARFNVDVEAVEKAIRQGLVAFVRDTLQIIALAGLALALDPWLGLVGLAAFPPIGILIIRIGRRLRKRRLAVHTAFGGMSAVVDETVAGLSVIRSFGAEELMEERFTGRSRSILATTVRAVVLKAVSSPVNELLGSGALAATLWYAHARIAEGALTPEAFISFFSALFLLYQPVKGLGQAQHAVQSGLAALERLAVLVVADESSNDTEETRRELPDRPTEIRLEKARVGYADREAVLSSIDLTISAGSKIAVVGRSGSGKSTLLNLLQGFLPLRGGRLLVNGEPIMLDPLVARRLFAPVPQEPHLFDDTIRMNVLCGRPTASEDDVSEACRAAGVTQIVKDMRDGIDRVVGPGGKALSLGQRQRVCLARALLSHAPVLLLDEVTASLDGETEHALVEALDGFLMGRTVLVVTHRLATAEWADQVAFLEDGIISAAGPSGILGTDDRLKRLFGAQSGTATNNLS
ncbi:MAG: ABC transporter ATP-binding protein [Deltaproteobacteria bacterium]|nr:ABC transporter ATP-binding protein [Deltaproteobacteria bacterium]